MKKFTCCLCFAIAAITCFSQNIGIGTNTPAFKLDVVGRIRLQQNTGTTQTAGLWLDGTLASTRSFIGTFDNDHVGIWGGGIGWNFSMNVNNGNTGIGTMAPTATLDVNGAVRLRGQAPAKGSLLISSDTNGNATWQKLYAFKVSGLLDVTNIYVSPGQTIPLVFNAMADYNIGLMYSTLGSSFTAPVKGIYHFDAHTSTYKTSVAPTYAESASVQLMMKRGATTTILEQSRFSLSTMDGSNLYGPSVNHSISADVLLEANDVIWVQVTTDYPQLVEGDKYDTSFSGRLVNQTF